MRTIYGYLFCCMILLSCKKEFMVTAPEFNVDVATTGIKAGEEVTFAFSGAPDFISFYSGEKGNDYAFREGRVEKAQLLLSFESQVLNNRAGTQDNQLAVLVSEDYNGKATMADVEAAHWKDISSTFGLATLNDNNEFVASGKKDIADFVDDGVPVYFAFKYTTLPKGTNGVSANFVRVRNFLLEAAFEDGSSTSLLTHANAGITPPKELIKSANYQSGRGNLQATYINFYGNTSADLNKNGVADDDETTHAWAISNPVTMNKTTDLGPDQITPIKSVADPALTMYKYKYTKPGTYKAVFIAKNATVHDDKAVLREVEITVQP